MIPYEDVTEEIIAKEAYKIYPYGSRVETGFYFA